MALFNAPKTDSATPAKQASDKKYAEDVQLPDRTVCQATAVRVLAKMTSTGKHMFSVKWEDEFKRSAWQNIVISPESEKAMKFLYGRIMPVFGLTQDIIEADDTTPDDIANDMTGCKALITVEHTTYNGTTRANVKWIDTI